ncbi:2-vinyl bacteriochlorophyllide hydratase [uncultured Erythrobacter sp.]|uniref:2-vinyl bacteriochlorophyllide hydratase n=1 Tax=uncultured Erythrobacter sp. TaxID=263913 RepID=UPI0026055BF2|nr:2-vinyl bacteriochlorophyllide hydratase [uncultured Erythrobacter sp.]
MTRTTHASPAVSPQLQGAPPERFRQGTQGRNDRRNDGSLYSAEERRRRDESVWTLVQGVLAPLQFLVFAVSLVLVVRTLMTGEGAFAADISIIIKTLILYTIMVTGSIWEKVVFDKWLFAPAFFWEDVFSMLVLALHSAYLVMLFGAVGTVEQRLGVALAAYAAYVINAGQFLWKLRMARLQGAPSEAVPA